MFIAGWAVWTLVQYLGHRGWHLAVDHESQQSFAVGERKHHENWKNMGVCPANHSHLSPPVWAPILVSLVTMVVCGFGFGLGFLTGFLFDHLTHQQMHKNRKLAWLARFHQEHHDHTTGNFGVSLGLVWDLVFGTFHGQSSPWYDI